MYCRVFLRIAPSIVSASCVRSISRVRRGCTYTGERRTPCASRAFAGGFVFGAPRVAEQAHGHATTERLAQRDDRVGELVVVNEWAARRVCHVESSDET